MHVAKTSTDHCAKNKAGQLSGQAGVAAPDKTSKFRDFMEVFRDPDEEQADRRQHSAQRKQRNSDGGSTARNAQFPTVSSRGVADYVTFVDSGSKRAPFSGHVTLPSEIEQPLADSESTSRGGGAERLAAEAVRDSSTREIIELGDSDSDSDGDSSIEIVAENLVGGNGNSANSYRGRRAARASAPDADGRAGGNKKSTSRGNSSRR